MSTEYITQKEAQQLVSNLREAGIKEEGIYTRIISEGFDSDEAEEIMQLARHDVNPIQGNGCLSAWLNLHIIIIIPSILIMILVVLYVLVEAWPLSLFYGLILVDPCIQLWCINKLWKNELIGFYGLMILFVLRVVIVFVMGFVLAIPLNLIDAIFLCVAVYTSRTNIVREKAKRKPKVKV